MPTTEVPLCINCKFCIIYPQRVMGFHAGLIYSCSYHRSPVDNRIRLVDCEGQRSMGICGPSGKLFEPKEEPHDK